MSCSQSSTPSGFSTYSQRRPLAVQSPAGSGSAVIPVGKMVSFSKPDPQVDIHSNLHILYQDGPHSSHYAVYNTDGQLIKRQAFEITNTRPRLRVDFDGEINVVGGLRRTAPTDFPPSSIEVPQDDSSKDKSPGPEKEKEKAAEPGAK